MKIVWETICDYVECAYWVVRCTPSIAKHVLGRWHFFRDEGNDLVEMVAALDIDDADDILRAWIMEARAEKALRARR